MSTLVKIEETYLKLFKIVLLAILTLALLAAIVTVIKGIIDFTAKPQPVAPAQNAPEPKVDVEAFIKALEQRDQPPASRPAAPPPEAPRANPMDELAATHLAKAWSYYDAYQKACNVPTKIEQDGFMSSDFPRNSFRNWFRKYGPNFAESQDNFIRTVLAHPRVIKICVDKQGRGGGIIRNATRARNSSCKVSDDTCVELRVSEKQNNNPEIPALSTFTILLSFCNVRASKYLAYHRSHIYENTK